MIRMKSRKVIFAMTVGTVVLTACSAVGGQTPTTDGQTTTPTRKVPAPRAAKAATATKPGSTATPARRSAAPARSASVLPARGAPTAGTSASAVKSATPQTTLPDLRPGAKTSPTSSLTSAPTNAIAAPSSDRRGSTVAGDPRSPVAATGLGTFRAADFTLTAYGCFRTGTRVLCDFDATKQHNRQMNAASIWSTVDLVDDGGRITKRHTAYFMGDDGNQFPVAFLSTTAVRMILEYDNVSPQFTSVSLVNRRERIQGVPITPVDASQPAANTATRGAATGGATQSH